jgi:ubiquinone/menaquinone biosynthesis C-methylase UbiE
LSEGAQRGDTVSSASRIVQSQFGDKAEAYATSAIHADRHTLAQLVELLQPQETWQALDVATGAGHTAHVLAPHVASVVASDLTAPMLAKSRALAREKGLANVRVAGADAEQLPFAAASFDLVTCRLAAHHFPSIPAFLVEAARVLRPGGRVAIVDNIVPGSFMSGRKARLQQEAGRYINAVERLRDPSHARCLSLAEWRQAFVAAGFVLEHEELDWKWLAFGPWAARMGVTEPTLTRLRVLFLQAPSEVLEFLSPRLQGDTIEFRLSEALFVVRR